MSERKKKTKIRVDRLRMMAEHLLHGKLGHKKFDFSQVNNCDEAKCGTLGCAMGENPIVFKEHFKWNEYGDAVLRRGSIGFGILDNRKFYGLSMEMNGHLFFPGGQNKKWGPRLGLRAKKEQVASNILRFCELVENGTIQ